MVHSLAVWNSHYLLEATGDSTELTRPHASNASHTQDGIEEIVERAGFFVGIVSRVGPRNHEHR